MISNKLSIAPMMEWSDRHCRYFWRLMTKHTLLYTEMVASGALIYGEKERFLKYNAEEHPLALQLGGSNPKALADCARMAEDWGYDEVNLNCGCPSDRVQSGKIGAILMSEPKLVAQCIKEMINACSIPVTVKHRIGIDDMDDFSGMKNFVDQVADVGCSTFIVHARKAWLKGLSPKENREVPPLKYEYVFQLKQERPELNIVINGGITTLEQTQALLKYVDGVMIGRQAYQDPFFLNQVDELLYQNPGPNLDRDAIVLQYADYCDQEIAKGNRLHHMSRHILGLYHGQYGARQLRRFITQNVHKPGVTGDLLREAVSLRHTHLQTRAGSHKLNNAED